MSLWGWVGVAVAEGVVASNGGSLEDAEVSQDPRMCRELLGDAGSGAKAHGRKLQADDGRLATRVKISEMRRCCTLVS